MCALWALQREGAWQLFLSCLCAAQQLLVQLVLAAACRLESTEHLTHPSVPGQTGFYYLHITLQVLITCAFLRCPEEK